MIKKKNFLLIFLALSSFFALALAYSSQYFFALKPCVLCLYQRYPFFIIFFISVLGIFLKSDFYKRIIFYIAIAFLAINASLAFYHAGVEKRIFKFHSTCTDEISGNLNSVKELQTALQAAPARCDEPGFIFLNLSLASWNFLYCLLILITLLILRQKSALPN